MRRPISLFALALIAMLWSTALIAAPTDTAPRLSALTYAAGSLICHQRPERSFHREGAQYPVCARCLGLYAGAVAGVFAWIGASGTRAFPHRRVSRVVGSGAARYALTIAAIPTLASVLTGSLGWWDGSNAVRATLALPLGAVVAAVVAAVAAGDLR